MLGLGQIFTIFFVTLGPLKLLGPFLQQTHDLEEAALRKIALLAFIIGLASVIIGGYVGSVLAANWSISLPAISIATGLIFFLVAMELVMAPYRAPQIATAAALPSAPIAAALRLTFPLVVTPYGIAALIALLSEKGDAVSDRSIYILLVVVMVLDYLAMFFARQIMRGAVLLILQVLGAVLGVLQVGLAVQIIIHGLRELQVLAS